MSEDSERRTNEICMSFPEATGVRMGRSLEHWDYRVRNKIFAYHLDNHHGDGRVALWMKAAPGVQQSLVSRDPVRFFAPPYVGPKGWIGVRVDIEPIDWDEIADLIELSYRLVAPKKLVTLLDQTAI